MGITVRRMGFEFPDEIDPVFIKGQPEESFNYLGLSLLLPYLEPYLIRTMKVAKAEITDPQLRDDLQRFCAQEGQHYREHMRFNAAVGCERFPQLAKLEADLQADYQRFTKTKSLRFNLAYAEGFEALTTASARYALEERDLATLDSPIAELLTWHAIEELEHRTVAFDVYDRVCGGYAYRLVAGLYAQWHMGRFIARVASELMKSSPEVMESHGGADASRARLRKLGGDAFRKLLPNVLRTYLPGYTPHNIELTPQMLRLSEHYTAIAKSVQAPAPIASEG